MRDHERHRNHCVAALLCPAQADKRLAHGLVSVDAHRDQHVRRVIHGDQMKVDDQAARNVAREKQHIAAPDQHGEYVAERHVDVGNAQVKNEKVHARQLVLAVLGLDVEAQQQGGHHDQVAEEGQYELDGHHEHLDPAQILVDFVVQHVLRHVG